jgi:hypothetical protein
VGAPSGLVATGEGVAAKAHLPPTATVLVAKQGVESELGARTRPRAKRRVRVLDR